MLEFDPTFSYSFLSWGRFPFLQPVLFGVSALIPHVIKDNNKYLIHYAHEAPSAILTNPDTKDDLPCGSLKKTQFWLPPTDIKFFNGSKSSA